MGILWPTCHGAAVGQACPVFGGAQVAARRFHAKTRPAPTSSTLKASPRPRARLEVAAFGIHVGDECAHGCFVRTGSEIWFATQAASFIARPPVG
jgi:hypothetical protein